MSQERPEIRISYNPTPEQQARNKELAYRQEMRMEHLVPIYLMWTSDVPHQEALAAQMGVEDALRASAQDRQLVVFGNRQFGGANEPFSSPDWYIDEAKRRQGLRRNAGYGEQVDVNEVMTLFAQEPYQEKPHWEVFVTGQDLNSTGRDGEFLNYVFGATQTAFPSSVQSVRRLIEDVPAGPLRLAMVRRLLRHEVGHMFLLPARNTNVTESLGRHCTNVCTMRQGLSIPEWAQNTRQEEQEGTHFCNDCMSDLGRLKGKYKPLV